MDLTQKHEDPEAQRGRAATKGDLTPGREGAGAGISKVCMSASSPRRVTRSRPLARPCGPLPPQQIPKSASQAVLVSSIQSNGGEGAKGRRWWQVFRRLKQFEPERTESAEEKICQKCAILGNSTAEGAELMPGNPIKRGQGLRLTIVAQCPPCQGQGTQSQQRKGGWFGHAVNGVQRGRGAEG